MEYVSGVLCRELLVRALRLRRRSGRDGRLRPAAAYAVSRLGAPPDSDDEGEVSGCVTRVVECVRRRGRVRPGPGAPLESALARGGTAESLLEALLKVFAEDGSVRLEWGSRKSTTRSPQRCLRAESLRHRRVTPAR